MLGKITVHALIAAGLITAAAAVYAQTRSDAATPPAAAPAAAAPATATPDTGYLPAPVGGEGRGHGEHRAGETKGHHQMAAPARGEEDEDDDD